MSKEALKFAVKMAYQAGNLMTDYFYRANKGVATKADQTLVTAADTRINSMLIAAVKQDFPDYGVLGEEESSNAQAARLWVCDPIDGTEAFILGVPTAMFSLALVEDGVPVVAVAFDPFQKQLFTAIKDDGARVNDEQLKVSATQAIKGSWLGGGGSYRPYHAGLLDTFVSDGAKVKAVPGTVFKGGMIARGSLDGFITGAAPHDVAAVKLIIEESGGKVTDLQGNEQRYDRPIKGVIMSNGHIHQRLVDALATYGVERFLGKI